MSDPRYVALVLVKDALNLRPPTEPSEEDALILSSILAVEQEIDRYTRRRFDLLTVTRTFDAPIASLLLVEDVTAISAVRLFTVPLDAAGYRIDERRDLRQPNVIRRLTGPWRLAGQVPYGALAIDGSWGWSAVPDVVARTALDRSVVAYQHAKAMFARRTARGEFSGETQGRTLDADARASLDTLRLRPYRQIFGGV